MPLRPRFLCHPAASADRGATTAVPCSCSCSAHLGLGRLCQDPSVLEANILQWCVLRSVVKNISVKCSPLVLCAEFQAWGELVLFPHQINESYVTDVICPLSNHSKPNSANISAYVYHHHRRSRRGGWAQHSKLIGAGLIFVVKLVKSHNNDSNLNVKVS